jgi:TonB family protein
MSIKKTVCLIIFTLFFCKIIQAQSNIEVINSFAPKYVSMVAELNISGEVVIEVTIDKDGLVTNAKVVSGHPLLRKNCEETIKKWKFNSQQIESVRKTNVKFEFILEDLSIIKNKCDVKYLDKEEVIFKTPFEVVIKGTLKEISKTGCSNNSNISQKLLYPFRKVASFLKKLFT